VLEHDFSRREGSERKREEVEKIVCGIKEKGRGLNSGTFFRIGSWVSPQMQTRVGGLMTRGKGEGRTQKGEEEERCGAGDADVGCRGLKGRYSK